MRCADLQTLRNFLRFLGESRLKLLLETLPDIEANLSDIDSIHPNFSIEVIRCLHELNLPNFSIQNFDIGAILKYQSNIEERWREKSFLLSPYATSSGEINTHENIDVRAYLGMLQLRHLAVKPWISDVLKGRVFSTGFDLGGGPAIALRLLKDDGIIREGVLVDRNDIMVEIGRLTRIAESESYVSNYDFGIIGDLTNEKTWEAIKARAESSGGPNLFILSDVLHGRSRDERDIILSFLGEMEGTKIIREFLGFSELDYLLFQIQLKLFTHGYLSTLNQFKEELRSFAISFEVLYESSYYYIIEVIK